jgi:hypothetical protein
VDHQKTSQRDGINSPKRIPGNGIGALDPATNQYNKNPRIPSKDCVIRKVVADAASKGKIAKGTPVNKVVDNTPV